MANIVLCDVALKRRLANLVVFVSVAYMFRIWSLPEGSIGNTVGAVSFQWGRKQQRPSGDAASDLITSGALVCIFCAEVSGLHS